MTVVAGPGYGKTAFVAGAFAAAGLPSAYLLVTSEERDPSGFLEALIATLGRAHEGLGSAALERLRECRDSEREVLSVMAALVEEMAAVPGCTYLAIDDVSEIEDSPGVLAALDFLAETLPAGWTFFLLSRKSLPCDLSPLRIQGRVTDIGLRRLRFTPGEIEAWAAQKWDLALEREAVRGLWKMTEGWPVALALLGERYRRRGKVRAKEDMVRLLRSGEPLRSYLTEHVFDLLEPAAAEVLLAASLLPRVVFPRDEDYLPGGRGRAEEILVELVENGLLVTETGYRTYLLHPLLRGYARKRLLALGDGYARRSLVAAAAHLESQDALLPAVSLYLEAGSLDRVLRPLRLHIMRHLNAATTFALREWLALVPENLARDEPWLLLVRGRVLQDEGLFAEAGHEYRAAARLFSRSGEDAGRLRALLGEAFCLFLCGRWQDSVECLESAQEACQSRSERAEVISTRGNVLLGQCRWDEAVELFEVALATVPEGERRALEERIFLYRARLFFIRGLYPTAAEWAGRAIARAGSGPRTTYAQALNTVATLEYLQGDYEKAAMHADGALALVRARGYAYLEGPALMSRAGADLGRRDYRSALRRIKRARTLSRASRDGEAEVWGLDMQGDLCRRNRNPGRALQLHREALELVGRLQMAEFEELRVRAGLGLDHAVAGHDGEAQELLEQVVSAARGAGVAAPLSRGLFYLGWLLAKSGDEGAAARLLKEAVDLFERHRHLHFVLQEASVAVPIMALSIRLNGGDFLPAAILPRLPARLQAYLERLAFGPDYPTDNPLGPPTYSRRELAHHRRPELSPEHRELVTRIAELTEREMEILRHIASGAPNKVIAADLFITEKTIKTHANKVYRKLRVRNRLQAVLALQEYDRLAQRGLLPGDARTG